MSADKTKSDLGRRFVGALVFTPAMLFAHLIALMVVVVVIVKAGSLYYEILYENDVPLPPVAQLAILFYELVTNYWYLLVLALIVIDGAVLFGLYLAPPWLSWLRTLWSTVLLLAMFLFIGFTVQALSYTVDRAMEDIETIQLNTSR